MVVTNKAVRKLVVHFLPEKQQSPLLLQRLELTLTSARLESTPLGLSLCKSLIDVQRMSKPLRTARARIAAPLRTTAGIALAL